MEENQQQLDENNSSSTNSLIVSENMRSYFYDMAKWASFLGYFGLIVCIFLLIAGATMSAKTADITNPFSSQMIGVILVFYALILIYPSILLISYAKKANEGVLYSNQQELEESINKLKSFFKYFGVLAIIGIVLNLISLLKIVVK